MNSTRNSKISFFKNSSENNRNKLFFPRNDETLAGDHDLEELPQKAHRVKKWEEPLFLWDTKVVLPKKRNIICGLIHCFCGEKKKKKKTPFPHLASKGRIIHQIVFVTWNIMGPEDSISRLHSLPLIFFYIYIYISSKPSKKLLN